MQKQTQKKYVNCWTCGKELTNPDQCSRCKITYYCSKDCQTKDWPGHRKYVCRPEGKDLKTFAAKGVPQRDFMMNKLNRQHISTAISECVMKTLKKQKIEDVGLYCNICGDLDELGKMNGAVLCSGCYQIQLGM